MTNNITGMYTNSMQIAGMKLTRDDDPPNTFFHFETHNQAPSGFSMSS